MKKVLMPVAALTPVLLMVLLMVLLAPATAFSQNSGPPAGPILDLVGTPLPGGGNGTYLPYTVNFTATQTGVSTTTGTATITFAFRDDVEYISFANASVVDLTADNGINLLTNGNFSGGVFGSTPAPPWIWANVSGTDSADYGTVQSGSSDCYTYPYCWYDGSLGGYDTISQTFTTNVGDNYQISFDVAENSFCSTNGSGLTCNFSDQSASGIAGIDVAVYVAGGAPVGTQVLTVTPLESGTGTVTDNLGQLDCYEAGGVVYQVSGGTPTVQPSGSCTASYALSTAVQLTATPNVPSADQTSPASTFGAPASNGTLAIPGWGGACSSSGKNPNECNLTMDSAQSVTANFVFPGQSGLDPITPGGPPAEYSYNGGLNNLDNGGNDFNLSLSDGSTGTTTSSTQIPMSQQACSNLFNGTPFEGAYCFVYQLGITPFEPPDTAELYEVTCPTSPGGTCGSVSAADFYAAVGADFIFDTTIPENVGLTTSGSSSNNPPNAVLMYDGGNPSVGLIKFSGSVPGHPCQLAPGAPAPSPSNQVVGFTFQDGKGTAKPATGNTGGTGSCWVWAYNLPDEAPTASIAPGNDGQVYTPGSAQNASFTCTAVNNSLVSVGGQATGAAGPYLTVNTCTLYDAYGVGSPASYPGTTPPANTASGTNSTTNTLAIDTSTLGTHTLTATVVDSATNTVSSSTETYYVGSTTVTVGTSPAGLQFTVDGTMYNSAQQFTWGIGTQHTFATTAAQASTGTQYAFTGWSDGTGAASDTVVASSSTTSYTANFNTSYLLTTSANPSAGGSVLPASGYVAAGTVVPLTATLIGPSYVFTNWTGSVANANNAFTTVTMSGPQTVTANFTPTVQVTIGTSPSGLSFTVDGAPYTGSVTWTVGTQHTLLTTSPQVSSGTQYTFMGWSDGTGTASDTVVASSSTTSYTANFSTSYQLTTAANPSGDGSVAPSSGTYYPSGTVVPLQATANLGYNFSSWSGPVANPNSVATTVTMSGPASVAANFVVNNTNVTINTSPTGLQVSVDGGAAKAAPVNVVWQVGTIHTIATTSPQGSSGTQYTFTSWTDGGAISHSVTATAGTPSYTANFSTSYQLTTAASPSADGTVTPASGSYYAAGTVVNLTATANTGYVFSSWSGPVANPSSASTTVTMSGPETVTANFAAALWKVSPANYAFPTSSVGQTPSYTFVVTNPVGGATTAISVNIPGSGNEGGSTPGEVDADDYVITSNGCRGVSLAGGSSCNVTVTWIPDSDNLGLKNGSLAYLQVTKSSKTVLAYATMTGTAIDPTVSVAVNGNNNSFTSTSKVTQMVATVSNSGPTALILGSPSISSGGSNFAVNTTGSNSCTSEILAPGANCNIWVTFTPPKSGTVKGQVRILSNAANGTQYVTLSGQL